MEKYEWHSTPETYLYGTAAVFRNMAPNFSSTVSKILGLGMIQIEVLNCTYTYKILHFGMEKTKLAISRIGITYGLLTNMFLTLAHMQQ